MKKTEINDLRNSHFRNLEIALCSVVIAALTITFTFVYDLNHTSNCSLAYLDGHISDFYDYNINVRGTGTIVYYPTIYILYAIWNIPLKLFGVECITGNDAWILVYEKGLGLLFLGGVYYFTYKLTFRITSSKLWAQNSLLVLLLGIPIFVLFSFPWGLYDTVWLAFVLAGMHLLTSGGKKYTIAGIACFAVSVTLKTFALFLIIPVLCYRFKKVSELILSGIGVMSLYVLETVAYMPSEYFSTNVLSPLDGGFLFNALFGVSLGRFSVILVVFLLCCLFAYYIDRTEENDFTGYILIPFLFSSMFAALAQVTPGWAIMCMPFYAILIAGLRRKDRKIFYLANILLTFGELAYIIVTRGYQYAETALASGVFGKMIFHQDGLYAEMSNRGTETFTNKLFNESANGLMINYGVTFVFAVLLFACIIFLFKAKEGFPHSTEPIDFSERKFMYICTVVALALYIVPVFVGTKQMVAHINQPVPTQDLHCSIDSCNGVSILTSGEYTITKEDSVLRLEGWAEKISEEVPVDRVTVLCNDNVYEAQMQVERADVANTLDNDALLYSGWVVEIPADDARADKDQELQVTAEKEKEYKTFTITVKNEES